MKYWHEIVKSYDSPKSNDHGRLSERTSVLLLVWLAFGKDYASGISDYFTSSAKRTQYVDTYPKILGHPSKIGAVLKRMKEDKLVFSFQNNIAIFNR